MIITENDDRTPIEDLLSTLAVFKPKVDIPLHTILRYWYQYEGVTPPCAKRALVLMKAKGWLSVSGKLVWEKPTSILSEAITTNIDKTTMKLVAEVSNRSNINNSVCEHLAVSKAKLTLLEKEQDAYVKRITGMTEANPDPGSPLPSKIEGFSIAAGLAELTEQETIKVAREGRPKRQSSTFEDQSEKTDLRNLLTGYTEEVTDSKVSVHLTAVQHDRCVSLLKPDSGLSDAAKQRSMFTASNEAAQNTAKLFDEALDFEIESVESIFKNKLTPLSEIEPTEDSGSDSPDVSLPEMNEFINKSVEEIKSQAQSETEPFVPPEMYDDDSNAISVVIWKQCKNTYSVPPSALDSKMQRLNAIIIDAWQSAMRRTNRYDWHCGPDDGWYYQHITDHMSAAGLPAIESPEFFIAKSLVTRAVSHEELGINVVIFPYPTSTTTTTTTSIKKKGTDQIHWPAKAEFTSLISTDAIQQIRDLQQAKYLESSDLEPLVVCLALYATTPRVRSTYAKIIRLCVTSSYLHLLISQLCCALAFNKHADKSQGTWIHKYLIHESRNSSDAKLENKLESLLSLLPTSFNTHVMHPSEELYRALLYFAGVHESLTVRAMCTSILRSCECPKLVNILLKNLVRCSRIDETVLGDIWSEGIPNVDDRQAGTVSGVNGALALKVFTCFPPIRNQTSILSSALTTLDAIKDVLDDNWQPAKFEEDPWHIPNDVRVTQRQAETAVELTENMRNRELELLRNSLQSLLSSPSLWKLQAFNTIKHVAVNPGSRAARIVSMCLIKMWDRLSFDKITSESDSSEEAADLIHIIRDCLDPIDYIGIKHCIRVIPQSIYVDRGSIATLLQFALRHESEIVRNESAVRCLHVPERHWRWVASQMGETLLKYSDTPYTVQAIFCSCPSLTDRPPSNLLELTLTQAKQGCVEAVQLLKRSASFNSTFAMAAEGERESNIGWVIDSLPPLNKGCSRRLITTITQQSMLCSESVRRACQEGDERVAIVLVDALRKSNNMNDIKNIINALPRFSVMSEDVIQNLFELAVSHHPAAPSLRTILCSGATVSKDGGFLSDKERLANDNIRIPIANKLVSAHLPVVMQSRDDVSSSTSLTGILHCAPSSFLVVNPSHESIQQLLEITWSAPSLGCRNVTREFFAKCSGGTILLMNHLSKYITAYAKSNIEELGIPKGYNTSGIKISSRRSESNITGDQCEELISEQSDCQSLSDASLVRIIEAIPNGLNSTNEFTVDTLVEYSLGHPNSKISEACKSVILRAAMTGYLLEKLQHFLNIDCYRLRALQLLPNSLGEASFSLLSSVLHIAMSHHDTVTRYAAQDVLRNNQNVNVQLPHLIKQQLSEVSSRPSDVTLGVLSCLDGKTLPPILLPELCTLVQHSSDVLAAASFNEARKVKSADKSVLPVLMKCVTYVLAPRLTSLPDVLLLSLVRSLTLMTSWNLCKYFVETDIENLLSICLQVVDSEAGDLAHQLLRKGPKVYGGLCLRKLLREYGYDKPMDIAVGLPVLPPITDKYLSDVSPWEYNKLVSGIIPCILKDKTPWAIDLCRRSESLWPIMVDTLQQVRTKLPTTIHLRNRMLYFASNALISLPNLSSIVDGHLVDFICAIADGIGAEDVVTQLLPHARRILLAGSENNIYDYGLK